MNIFFSLAILTMFFSCRNNNCPEVNRKAEILNNESEYEFKKGNIDLAITMCDQIISKYPKNYVAYSNRGSFKLVKSKTIGMLSQQEKLSIYNDIQHSFSICPDYSQGYRNLIATAHNIADHNTVIEYSNIYINKFSNDTNTLHFDKILSLYGFSLHAIGRIEEAKKYLDIVINNYANDPFAYIVRGKCFRDLKQFDKAMKDFDMAINIDSTEYLGYHERAYCFKLLGKRNEAERDYIKAIAIDSNRFEPYYGLGVIRIEQRDTLTACQYYFKALRLNKNELRPYINEKTLLDEISKVCK